MTVVAARTALFAELTRIELRGVCYEDLLDQEGTLKEYVWKHCQDQIFASLKVETLPRGTDNILPLAGLLRGDNTAPTSSSSSPSDVHGDVNSNRVAGELGALFSTSSPNQNPVVQSHDPTEENKNNTVKAYYNAGAAASDEALHSLKKVSTLCPTCLQSNLLNNGNNDSLLLPTPPNKKKSSPGRHKRSPSTQLEWMQQDVALAAKQLKLLDKMTQIQRQYLQLADSKSVFQQLLATILELMESEYGFIGEVHYDDENTNTEEQEKSSTNTNKETNSSQQPCTLDGINSSSRNNSNNEKKRRNMYLQTHAITNIAWDAATRKFYRDNFESGLRFENHNSLFGAVMMTEKPIVSNTPQTDPRSGGTPPGHPPLISFLGLPFFDTSGNMNGMVGIANKAGGYSPKDIEFLAPFVALCGNLIQAYRNATRVNKSTDEKLYELELANVQLAQAHQKVLRQSALQLQHFACSSHEIRTPLNCIIGLSSLLQETELNPMQAESMQLISSSSELLLTVVNDVLDYSKLESGHVAVSIQPSNLQETLMGVIQSMELKSRDKNIRVRTEYAPSLPPLWRTDRLRLQQILFNLLGNAFKFSDNNSCIDLKVQLGPPNRPTIETHATPLRVPRVLRFIVQDYGCGIHQDQLENIFQPFVQAGDDTHRLYEGTGLGLAITSKLVQALGGCVYANSVVGEGSEFCVEFPYDQEEFDVEGMTERLSKTMVLVVPGRNIASDQVPVLEAILGAYQVDYRIFSSIDDLDHVMLQSSSAPLADFSQSSHSSSYSDDSTHHVITLPRDRSYVCLIDESVYVREIWQRWKEHPCASVLLTFGPDYTVAETSNHYRNLLQLLPSVLIQSFADSLEDAKALKTPNLRGKRRNPAYKKGKKPNAPTREKHDVSILIVEDNGINQKVLMALLKKIGYTNVSVVGDGSLAVDAVEHNKFDVVLMDVQMPVMDGLTATRIIGERQKEKFVEGDKTPPPKIVFVTASVDQELEEQATKLGAVGFVPKPFNLRQLETCMTELCRSLT